MKLKYVVAMLFAAVVMGLSAQGYKDGVEFYKAQRFNQARTLLQRNLDKPGTDKAASYYYLGMIEMQVDQPDLDAAQKDFQDGIAANPKYAYNYVGQGLVDLKRGDAKAAGTKHEGGKCRAGTAGGSGSCGTLCRDGRCSATAQKARAFGISAAAGSARAEV